MGGEQVGEGVEDVGGVDGWGGGVGGAGGGEPGGGGGGEGVTAPSEAGGGAVIESLSCNPYRPPHSSSANSYHGFVSYNDVPSSSPPPPLVHTTDGSQC